MRRSGPAPRRLVEDGRVQFGTFRSYLEEANLLDAAVAPGWPLPRWAKGLRLKQWQAAQIVTDRCLVSLALFDTRQIGLVQVKVFDRHTGERAVFERKVAPWSLRLARSLLDSEASYEAPGCRLGFHNALARARLTASFAVDAKGAVPLSGELSARADDSEPLVVSIPFGPNRGMYSTKAHLPVEGNLRWGATEINLDPATSWLLLDDHKGYYPYTMKWDWVVGAGLDPAGRRVSFNLTHNQSIDPDQFNENAVWVAGKLFLLPAVTVARSGGTPERWTVRDRGGEVELEFEVVADHRVNVDALVLRSRYRGPVGTFRGRLAPAGEPAVDVGGFFGMGEQFLLRC